jgi:hypothetical protein
VQLGCMQCSARYRCCRRFGDCPDRGSALLCACLQMTNAMPNYPYFLTQVTTLVYIPIFFGVVAYEMAFTNYITPEMRAFPKLKFLWMGCFDALAGIFMVFGGVHTSGSTQQCLLQAVIPITSAFAHPPPALFRFATVQSLTLCPPLLSSHRRDWRGAGSAAVVRVPKSALQSIAVFGRCHHYGRSDGRDRARLLRAVD